MDLTALFACVALAGAAYAGPAIYPHYMDPRRHPDETRRAVKPPDRAQFGNRMQFTSIRHLPDNAAWRDALDTYVVSNRLGNLVWPNLKVLGNGNLPEIVAEIKRRGLWLFDVWGYLPNGKAQGVDGLWRMPPGVCEMLERELGDRWLGMDNGEQDGRWSGSPRPAPGRFAHLLRFQRYFEHMDKTLGNKMAALVSLNYGHYFLRANCYTMLGAETAQALPNGQVYYAFIRGAGKQYGVPWFGNVSVFNRWGWKCYPEKETPGADSGPEKGASLALLKKLLYTQLFYNGLACGFEGSFFHGGFAGTGALSPVGEIQQEAVDWIDRHGDPGVMAVPVGLVIDSARGWCFPRHLYSGWSHVCWGAIPFERSDYFTDGVLDLLYPGYQDSGFFRDERGFNAPTPYGDIADCLLSDAPLWVLKQYALLVLAGAIQPTEEFRDALAAYVAGGGRLVLTEGNRRALFPAGLPAAANGGTVTVIASDWGVAEQPRVRKARYPVETPYVSPYPLTDAARRALDAAFRDAALFTVSPDFLPGERPLARGLPAREGRLHALHRQQHVDGAAPAPHVARREDPLGRGAADLVPRARGARLRARDGHELRPRRGHAGDRRGGGRPDAPRARRGDEPAGAGGGRAAAEPEAAHALPAVERADQGAAAAPPDVLPALRLGHGQLALRLHAR